MDKLADFEYLEMPRSAHPACTVTHAGEACGVAAEALVQENRDAPHQSDEKCLKREKQARQLQHLDPDSEIQQDLVVAE